MITAGTRTSAWNARRLAQRQRMSPNQYNAVPEKAGIPHLGFKASQRSVVRPEIACANPWRRRLECTWARAQRFARAGCVSHAATAKPGATANQGAVTARYGWSPAPTMIAIAENIAAGASTAYSSVP